MVSLQVEDWLVCGCNQPAVEEELICDYSKKITPLYWAIQSHQWASVNKFLKTGYWKDSFFRDPVRPERQVKTWMVRYNEVGTTTTSGENENDIESTSDKQKVICWKQLPLHAAIVYSAPAIIIQKLLHMYPAASKCSDNRGNLPIHLAFRHGSNDAVLALLLQEYPEGMNAREANGLLPTECATDLPSPQPLRGALLRTAMSKEDDKSRSSIVQSHLKSERFFFDDRPITPHQGNLSTKSSNIARNNAINRSKSPFDPKYHLSVLTQQVENLRTTVESALTTPANSNNSEAVKSDLPAHLQTTASQTQAIDPSSQQEDEQPLSTTSKQDPYASVAGRASPVKKAATPLSPTTLATLQDFVTRALVGSSSGTPQSETNQMAQDALANNNDPPSDPTQSLSLPQLPPPTTSPTSRDPQEQQQAQPSPYHAQQNMPHTAPDPLAGAAHGALRSRSPLCDLQLQHQKQQQKLQQLHENRQQLHVRPTATFEEQRRQLDSEVSKMEERMANMEQVMKEMYKREKTVRRELALTLKEVKHWKAQAKRAATEEEKNRILTEMLHEFVPTAATTPRLKNKTPPARGEMISGNRFPSNHHNPEPESRDETPRRSKVVMLFDDETAEHFHPVQQRDPESHGPRSNRHSDVGFYEERDQYDRVRAGTSSRYTEEPQAIPIRRIQSENYQRWDQEMDITTPLHAPGRTRVDPHDEVREAPCHRGFTDPPTTSGKDTKDSTDDDTNFSLSLVEKVAALQAAKQQKSRNFKYKSALANHQTRKKREAQAEYAHGGWRARDPEMHTPVSPQSKHAVYHGHDAYWGKSTPKTAYSKSTHASSSVSDSDYYPRD